MCYLSGPNPILIFFTLANFFPAAGLFVPAEFPTPPPPPRLHLLQNVTIRDMKLKPTEPKVWCLVSGWLRE
ncbi:hypothetical protein H1R20_g15230, partial [Candolleomyces eurysporus]